MDSFECAVCLQQFDDPRVISCGHTFCQGCLQKLKPNQFLCPLCRRAFESIDSLPSNFVVLKWMEENKNQTTKKEDIKCDNCDEGKLAVVWCESCGSGANFCANCDSIVHQLKVLRNHLRISLKEKSKKSTFIKCKSHTRDNEVYCTDCKSLICTICVIDYHQQHQVKSVSKCAEEKRVELKSLVAPFQNLQPIAKKEQELKLDKEKNVKELKSIEARVQVLKNLIIQNDLNLQQITSQKEKIKTSEIVLITSIQEMRDMDLLESKNIDNMKKKIQNLLKEVYPEGDKERLEKERLEKERLEKERLEKERLEKERLEKERLEKEKNLVWERYGSSIQVTNQKTAISSGGGWVNGVVLGSIPMSEGTYYWELRIDKSNDDMYGISQQISQINCHSYYLTTNGFFIHHSSDIYGNVGNNKQQSFNCTNTGTIVGFELSIGSQKILKVFKNGSLFSLFDVSQMVLPLFPAVELYHSGAQCTIIKFEKR